MGNLPTAHEFQNRVSLYFDNVLREPEVTELLNQVNKDPDFSKVFDAEKKYRQLVKNKIVRPKVSTELIQAIKNSIKL